MKNGDFPYVSLPEGICIDIYILICIYIYYSHELLYNDITDDRTLLMTPTLTLNLKMGLLF